MSNIGKLVRNTKTQISGKSIKITFFIFSTFWNYTLKLTSTSLFGLFYAVRIF